MIVYLAFVGSYDERHVLGVYEDEDEAKRESVKANRNRSNLCTGPECGDVEEHEIKEKLR